MASNPFSRPWPPYNAPQSFSGPPTSQFAPTWPQPQLQPPPNVPQIDPAYANYGYGPHWNPSHLPPQGQSYPVPRSQPAYAPFQPPNNQPILQHAQPVPIPQPFPQHYQQAPSHAPSNRFPPYHHSIPGRAPAGRSSVSSLPPPPPKQFHKHLNDGTSFGRISRDDRHHNHNYHERPPQRVRIDNPVKEHPDSRSIPQGPRNQGRPVNPPTGPRNRQAPRPRTRHFNNHKRRLPNTSC